MVRFVKYGIKLYNLSYSGSGTFKEGRVMGGCEIDCDFPDCGCPQDVTTAESPQDGENRA